MKRLIVLLIFIIGGFCGTQNSDAGALGFEYVENQAFKEPGVQNQSVGGWFLNRLKAYVKETESKIHETLKRPDNVKTLSSVLPDEKQLLREDVLALKLDNEEMQRLQKEMSIAPTELKKTQIEQEVKVLKNHLLTTKIPSLVTKFSNYYINLDDKVRKNPEIQKFSQSIIDTINSVGVSLEGKYWQAYALLNDQEVFRAQQVALLDRLFNKNLDGFLRALKEFAGDDLIEGLLSKNFIQALKSPAYKTVQQNLALLNKVDRKELSKDSLLNVLTLQTIAYSLIAQELSVLLHNPQKIEQALKEYSSKYDQENYERDLKIMLRNATKKAVSSADDLEAQLRSDLEKNVEQARSDAKKMVQSSYLKMVVDNENANINEQQLVQTMGAFDKAHNELMRSLENEKVIKQAQENLDKFAQSFVDALNASDPSQLSLILMSKMQNAYNRLITAISRRGKEIKYGSKLSSEHAKELLQALVNAFYRSAQLGLLRSIVRDYLTVVVDGHVTFLPQIKREYANALIKDEELPADGVQAKRLVLIRQNSLQNMKALPEMHTLNGQSFPYLTWLIKGLKE